jgi:hypothetical protein
MAIHFTRALGIALVLSPIGSCSTSKTQSELAETPQPPASAPAADGGTMIQQSAAGCPMVVPGAEPAVSDTEGGIALEFTTSTGDVADLRARVAKLAQMYQMQHGRGGMMWHHMGGSSAAQGGHGMGHMGGQHGHGMGAMGTNGKGPMPAVSATVTDLDKGARLELRPTDPAQLDALREHLRAHQQRMHAGECWMMQDAAK